MTAREAGASVLLLAGAPFVFRGGNSRHTRNLRYLRSSGNNFLTGPYLEEEFWDDLMRVTGGKTDEELARLTIRASRNLGAWMIEHGCKFQPSGFAGLGFLALASNVLGMDWPERLLKLPWPLG